MFIALFKGNKKSIKNDYNFSLNGRSDEYIKYGFVY